MLKMNSSWLVTGAIVIAGLALGSVIDRQLPSAQEVLREPFVHAVEVGQTARLRTVDVTVTSWQVTGSVIHYGSRFDTVGAWVVVDLDILARDEPRVLAGMEMVSAGGRTYGGSGDISIGCDPAQPGVPVTCQIAFEVAVEDLPGLKLHIPAAGIPGAPGDDLAIVDLGIAQDDPGIAGPTSEIELVRTGYGEGR